jgi:hypothetical protein
MKAQPALPTPTDPDSDKGAVEGDRPTDTQHANENATALGEDVACPQIASRSPKTSSAPTPTIPRGRELTLNWQIGKIDGLVDWKSSNPPIHQSTNSD